MKVIVLDFKTFSLKGGIEMLNQLQDKALKMLGASEIPMYAKEVLGLLLQKYGVEWHVQLGSYGLNKSYSLGYYRGEKISVSIPHEIDLETWNEFGNSLDKLLMAVETKHSKLITTEFNWHIELTHFDDQSGSGLGGRLSVHIPSWMNERSLTELQVEIEDLLEQIERKFGKRIPDPLEKYDDFLREIASKWNWEDDFNQQQNLEQILGDWQFQRIEYYRAHKGLKLQDARQTAYSEIESEDFGGKREACRQCGLIFFNNLGRHWGTTALYCSPACEILAKIICIQCHTSYEVGKCSSYLRWIRLEGFCSDDCKTIFRDEERVDKSYISRMKGKALEFGVNCDETITRREVFKRANGLCYLCNQITHFEQVTEWSPLLATVDHIVPWIKGGEHVWSNVANCCFRCNMSKGDR